MRGFPLLVAIVLTLGPRAAPVVGAELDQLPLGDPARSFELAAAPAGSFFDCREGQPLELAAVVERLAGARVVLLGEEHTDMEQKLLQARIVEELARRVPKLVLGMEFFERGDAEVLARWTSGELDGEEFLRASHWLDRGSYRFEYYRPVMEAARRAGLRVVGVNVAREIPQAVNRGGLAALSDEQRREVGAVETAGSPQHRYLVSRYFGDTVARMPAAWLDNMYAAQCLWDVVMARSILANLGEGETMVVVVGSGHVAYDLGIARRIHEELAARSLPDLRVATYVPVTAPPPPEEDAMTGHPVGEGGAPAEQGQGLFVRSLADVVAVLADRGGVEAYPTLGARLEASAEGAGRVAMVWPGSLAASAGLERGDVILDVNGSVPADLLALRVLLAGSAWGQRLDLKVRRGEGTLDVAMLLEPEVRTSEVTVAPGWTVEPAGPLDPASSTPVAAAPAPDPEAVRRLLVTHPGQPRLLEVWRGELLDELHELGADGRVVRSLYRQPAADGAVEVRFARDPEGSVSGTSRCDRAGRPVAD